MTTIVLEEVKEGVVVAHTPTLEEKLATAVEESPKRLQVGLLHVTVDLDAIETVYGASTRRHLIEEVEARLGGSLRSSDPKVPQSDGAFCVVLPGLGTQGDLQLVAEGVLNALTVAYKLPGHRLKIPVHIGAALCGHGHRGVRNCIKAGAALALDAEHDHVGIKMADGSALEAISRRLHLRPARKTDRNPWTGIRTPR